MVVDFAEDTTIPVIERLVENDIVPYMTHTQASVAETERAIDAGSLRRARELEALRFLQITLAAG